MMNHRELGTSGLWGVSVLLGAMSFACGGDMAPAPSVVVNITYGSTDQAVGLADLPTVDVDGAELVRLSDLLPLAGIDAPLPFLKIGLESADGFNPATKDTCDGFLPAPGTALARGYIDPVSRNLTWDADLDYPGCLWVDDTAKIILEDGAVMTVTHGGIATNVELTGLDTVTVDTEALVLLSSVVAAAGIETALDQMTADFRAEDGYAPGTKSDCAPLIPIPAEDLGQGYVDPWSRNLSWHTDLGYPGCLRVKNNEAIILTDL